MRIRWTSILVAALLTARCGDGPTAPKLEPTAAPTSTPTLEPTAAPTSTPTPSLVNVAGRYSGTFQGFSINCAYQEVTVKASADLSQDGDVVRGKIGGCAFHGAFSGSVRGNRLTGSVDQIQISGTATGSHISAKVEGRGGLVNGRLSLDRP